MTIYEELPPVPGAPAPAEATAPPVQVTQQQVDPETQTVAGQITGLLDAENSYIKRARERAAETANQRGLFNSSIAANAGEAAAIDASLPIASQDAGVFQKQSLTNQSALNTAALQDAQALTNTSLANAAAENQLVGQGYGAELEQQATAQKQDYQLDALDAEYGHRLEEVQARLAADMDLQTMKNAGAMDLQTLKNQATEMQLDAGAYENYLNSHLSVQTLMNAEIRAIQEKEGVTAADKTAAISEATGRYQDSFAFIDQIYSGALSQWDWNFF